MDIFQKIYFGWQPKIAKLSEICMCLYLYWRLLGRDSLVETFVTIGKIWILKIWIPCFSNHLIVNILKSYIFWFEHFKASPSMIFKHSAQLSFVLKNWVSFPYSFILSVDIAALLWYCCPYAFRVSFCCDIYVRYGSQFRM